MHLNRYPAYSEVKFKVVIVGDTNVGKSCIIHRFGSSTFSNGIQSTVGVDYLEKVVSYDDSECKLQIWDTAGQERFRTIIAGYYRGADSVIFVFDKTGRKSFESVDEWVEEVSEYTSEKVLKVLAGNKNDCNSLITDSEGYAKANHLGLRYFSVSAKTGNGVNCLFDYITKELIEKSKQKNGDVPAIRLGGSQSYSRSWCC